jgi:hypothetical protein
LDEDCRTDRADLDVAETQRAQRIEVVAVLVEAGRETDGMREAQSACLDRQRSRRDRCGPPRAQ